MSKLQFMEELHDDIWMVIFCMCDVGDMISSRIACKYFCELTNPKKHKLIRTYYEDACKMLCKSIPLNYIPKYNNWYLLFQQLYKIASTIYNNTIKLNNYYKNGHPFELKKINRGSLNDNFEIHPSGNNNIFNFDPSDFGANCFMTPLMIACCRNAILVLEMLLFTSQNHSCSVESWNKKVDHGEMDDMYDLDPNATTKHTQTALHIACEMNNYEAVQFLLDHFKDIIKLNIADEKGNTPLHICCMYGYDEIVKQLLDVMCLNYAKNSFTHCNCNEEMVENRRCQCVNIQNKNGRTPLMETDSLNVFKLFVNYNRTAPKWETGLFYKDKNGDTLLMRYIHRWNSIVSQRGKYYQLIEYTLDNISYGTRDLCFAIKHCSDGIGIINMLLKRGVNPNSYDYDYSMSPGPTPLVLACKNNIMGGKIIDVLLKYGTYVNDNIMKGSRDDTSALIECVTYQSLQSVVKLLKLGANVWYITDSTGETAFHRACQRGDYKIVEYIFTFIKSKSNFNDYDYDDHDARVDKYVNLKSKKDRWTPLHYACANGHESVVKYLVNCCNVDVLCNEFNGRTSSIIAFDNNETQIGYWIHEQELKAMQKKKEISS